MKIDKVSMKDYLRPTEIISEVRMKRTINKQQTYVLVEGDTDIAFYKNIIEKKCCKIKFCDGRENVEKAILECNKAKIRGVIGIIDRDFDAILGIENDTENLFITDTHDMETMSLKDQTFERVNNEYGDDDKLEKFEKNKKKTLFDKVLEIGICIGKIRLSDKINKFEIGFNDMEIKDYLTDDFEFETENFINNAIRGSKQKNNKYSVVQKIEEELAKDYDVWQICRGHDLTEIIAACYSNEKASSVGNHKAKYLRANDIERALRMSYVLDKFYNTNLYKSIVSWQSKNEDMRILNSMCPRIS